MEQRLTGLSAVLMLILIGTSTGYLTERRYDGSSSSEREGQSINDMVIEFIEQFKQLMPCGIPELGVPALVPLELEHTEFEFEQKGLLYLQAELKNVLIDALDDFDVVDIDVKLLQMQLDFSLFFNSIKTAGHYNAKGKAIGLIPFNRGGKFGFNVNGLDLKGSIKLGLNGDNIAINEFKLYPRVKSVNSKFEHVFLLPLNTFIFNKVVEGVVPNFLRDNQEAVSAYLEDLVKPQMNELLKDFTLQDLMDLVGGVAGGDGNSTLPSGC